MRNIDNIKQKLKKFKGKQVMVIGDLILDKFVDGEVTRMSPEAKAPVVLEKEEKEILGGAANVAANIKSMGGEPLLLSVVGKDVEGEVLKKKLKNLKIRHMLFIDNNRPTTLKVRIFGNNKYLLRFDREKKDQVSKKISKKIVSAIKRNIINVSTVVFSDYDKGCLNKEIVREAIKIAKKRKLKIIADVKPKNIHWFKGVDLIKPNKSEAIIFSRTKNLFKAAKNISDLTKSDILITRGSAGSLLYISSTGSSKSIPGVKVRLRDIVGAGDVSLAALALGMATGLKPFDSARIANIFSALSVQKHGTATVKIKEIYEYINGKN